MQAAQRAPNSPSMLRVVNFLNEFGENALFCLTQPNRAC
jgi:hypothetical protein